MRGDSRAFLRGPRGTPAPRRGRLPRPSGPPEASPLEEGLEEGFEEGFEEEEEGLFEDPQWHQPPASWPQRAAKLFVPLGPHEAAEDFILDAPCASAWRARLYGLLCRLPINEYSLRARLYPPASHLLTSAQLQRLFVAAGVRAPIERALDIGAGDGCLTAQLRPLCGSVAAAETSSGMGRRLARQGYEVWCEDVAETAERRAAEGRSFSLVTMFNVLDRCPRPQALLAGARRLLGPGGLLLLSTPLPFMASFYGWRTGWSGRAPEGLELGREGVSWEEDALRLLEEVLPSAGFRPLAVSRVPYLTGGDALDGGCLELDDIVVLAGRLEGSG